MKNRISVLFSVILGALLITSCSNVLQPNKKVADIEVKASLSGTMARETGSSPTNDDYSFIDDMLASSEISEEEEFFIYYRIISTLTGPDYGLTDDQACDILADKIINTSSDFSSVSGNEDFWIQIKTNFGQESEKVYPFAKQLDSIKSYYKSLIKITFNYYKAMANLGFDLSSGALDEASLENFSTDNPLALLEIQKLAEEYSNNLKKLTWPDSGFDFSTVSLKLNSVPFDQEVTFTLLINFNEKEEPEKFEFTRFVNPGLNVFDFTPGQTTDSGDDVINDDNGGSGGDDEGDPDTDPIVEPDPDTDPDPVVDPWEDYLTYYVSNSAADNANGLEDDPMSLSAAFEKCREKMYEGTNTKFAIILKDDITLSETLTVPESAYIVISGNYGGSIKTIYAGEDFENHMFSIEDHANLGLSSVALDGTNLKCLLFYCSHSVNEGDLETNPLSLTGTFTMENCTVTNFAGNDDIGIITMATGGEMNITGCTFYNNYVCATGAVYIISGTLNLNIDDLLDSTLDTINTNTFVDVMNSNIEATTANPCEIYLKGHGYFNDTNKFLNSNLYAVHVAGWSTLDIDGKYYSGTTDTTPLRIYSSTDGSTAESEDCINTITVDSVDNVSITDGGDAADDTDDATYTLSEYTPV